MRAESIRILAPVPGKDTVGIELPNKVSNMVVLRELMESDAWRNSKATIPIILGKDVAGKVMIADLAKAPHLLIAGSTGSGKSVCMNTLIMSLLYRFSPFDMKLILVDPKYVELVIYSPLPHLITPVVNDPTKVPYALRWGVNEMEHRYQVMAKVKAKNLEAFNNRGPDPEGTVDENGDSIPAKLPLLIIIIDELADIMMTEAKKDVETSICRIAQKGRTAGIHLVIATQTPRKDIITGVIKANLPTKIAFKVSNGVDSRVILDSLGAEKLLGKGDMLFKGPAGEMERIQGSMVSDPEIQKVADFVSDQVPQHFDTTVVLENPEEAEEEAEDGINSFPDFTPEEEDSDPGNDFIKATVAKYIQPGDDENVRKALEIILRENKVSTSYLQRRMGIGYNKSVLLAKHPTLGVLYPSADNIRMLHGLWRRQFHFGQSLFNRACLIAMLAQHTQVESLAFCLMWIEMITRMTFCDTPRWVYIHRQYIGTQMFGYPFGILLVFPRVEGAGRVYQPPAGFEHRGSRMPQHSFRSIRLSHPRPCGTCLRPNKEHPPICNRTHWANAYQSRLLDYG